MSRQPGYKRRRRKGTRPPPCRRAGRPRRWPRARPKLPTRPNGLPAGSSARPTRYGRRGHKLRRRPGPVIAPRNRASWRNPPKPRAAGLSRPWLARCGGSEVPWGVPTTGRPPAQRQTQARRRWPARRLKRTGAVPSVGPWRPALGRAGQERGACTRGAKAPAGRPEPDNPPHGLVGVANGGHIQLVPVGGREQPPSMNSLDIAGAPYKDGVVTPPQHRADLFTDPAIDPREGGPPWATNGRRSLSSCAANA